MRVTIDLPQNHQEVGVDAILPLLDMVQDLIRNQNWEDEPVSWEIELGESEISALRLEPYFEPTNIKPTLSLVH